MTVKLNIYGVSHLARKEKMEKELQDFIEDKEFEAIFLERRDNEASFKEQLKAFLFNPSIILWKVLYRLVGNLLAGTKNLLLRRELNRRADDERVVEDIAEERNIPIHCVDKSIEQSILDQGAIWMVWSWLIFLPMMYQLSNYLTSVTLDISIISLLGGFIGLLATIFMMKSLFIAFPFIYSEIDSRNIYMMANLLEISKKENYSNLLLVTGSKHVEGFQKLSKIGEIDYHTEKYVKSPIKNLKDITKKFM